MHFCSVACGAWATVENQVLRENAADVDWQHPTAMSILEDTALDVEGFSGCRPMAMG
jgi:hypothetical protein